MQSQPRGIPVPERTILHFQGDTRSLSREHETPSSLPLSRIENETFKIRFASNHARRESATLLVEKLYLSRGYQPDPELLRVDEKPGLVTLLVNNSVNDSIGTITLGPDGPDGLLADALYPGELAAMRREAGVRLLEFTRFAIDRHRGNSRRVLATLINIAFIYARQLNGNRVVIEVNPKHELFYQECLGFRRAGEVRDCSRVHAPAVLLALDLDWMDEQVRRFGGGRNDVEAGKSLYRYFLDAESEAGLLAILRGAAP